VNEYKVQLDVYNGPLDLLLYLIRRDEVDIYDIPIARITEQYCRYCETLRDIDPNLAGDFLVLAATLMEIKSRLLLPRPPTESDEPLDLGDPRSELVRQLLEYKRFKDASVAMAQAARLQAQRWPRGETPGPEDAAAGVDLEEVQIWDLMAAFTKLLEAIGRGPVTHDVIVDDTPVALHAADIMDRLVREGSLPLAVIFTGRTRSEMIGLFLALLELVRQHRVRAAQSEPFGEISLVLLSADPVEIGDEWERHANGEAATETDHWLEDTEAQAESAMAIQAVDDDLEDQEAFPELDAIRTDVDVQLQFREAGSEAEAFSESDLTAEAQRAQRDAEGTSE